MTIARLMCVSWMLCLAQTAPLAFEVASIKPSNPVPGPNDRTAWAEHGKYTATGVTLLAVLTTIQGIEVYQLVGAPRWFSEQRYDIAAKGDEGASRQQVEEMIMTMLADRCKLATHRETRELPVYVLVVDKNGSKMKQSAAGARFTLQTPGSGHWTVTGRPMVRFARDLTREVGRTVVDLTGLKGSFDFTLDWTLDQGVDGAEDPKSSGSIFTAVRDQLGLRLEARKYPMEVLVIDHVEKPAEN